MEVYKQGQGCPLGPHKLQAYNTNKSGNKEEQHLIIVGHNRVDFKLNGNSCQTQNKCDRDFHSKTD